MFKSVDKYCLPELSENERLEWSALGFMSNETVSLIAEFKRDPMADRDYNYFKAAIDLLNSVVRAEKTDKKGDYEAQFAQNLTNTNMFIDGWRSSGLPFPKSNKEYNEEIKRFIGVFEIMIQRKQPDKTCLDKIEKLFSYFGELASLKIHKSPLRECCGRH